MEYIHNIIIIICLGSADKKRETIIIIIIFRQHVGNIGESNCDVRGRGRVSRKTRSRKDIKSEQKHGV
jgi:hypothetical protein